MTEEYPLYKVREEFNKVDTQLTSIRACKDMFISYSIDYLDNLIEDWLYTFDFFRDQEIKRLGLVYVLNEVLKSKETSPNTRKLVCEALKKAVDQYTIDHKVLIENSKKLFDLLQQNGIISQDENNYFQNKLKLDKPKNLPEGLPNPQSEIQNLAERLKYLNHFNKKVQESQQNLKNNETRTNQNELQKNKDQQFKYTEQVLQSYRDTLQFLDKQHMKAVVELKSLIQKEKTL